MRRCHNCETEWRSEKRQPGFKEYCEACAAYLHCCLNCRFHDPSLHNQCKIPNTEWVGDRRGANFCDEFEFRDSSAGGKPEGEDDARSRAASLLGLEGEPQVSPGALFGEETKKPASFDDLFRT